MSVSRQVARRKAKSTASQEKAEHSKAKAQSLVASLGPQARARLELRQRVRHVLLITTLIGLVALRFFREPLSVFLHNYGIAARLGLISLLLGPAIFTWMIGYGQIKDQT